MRYFKSYPDSYTGTWTIEQPPDPMSPYIETVNGSLEAKTVSRADVVKNPIVNGWRAPSTYNAAVSNNGMIMGLGFYTEPTIISVPGIGRLKVDRRYTYNGYLGKIDLPVLTSVFGQNEINRLTTNCLNDIKNQKVNVSLAIIEMRESVSMVTKRALSLTRAARYAMSKQWNKAASALGVTGYKVRHRNSVHNGWLELQFGWLPVLQDIYGSYQALTDPSRLEGAIVVSRGRLLREFTEVNTFVTTSPIGNVPFVCKQFNEFRHELKGSFWYRMNLSHVSEAASLGMLNPLVVAWERVPFSFLFDYLAPVGSVLDALDATAGMNMLGISITRYSTVQSSVAGRPGTVSGKQVLGSCAGRANGMYMDRTVPTSGTPGFYWKNPFSAAHAANTVALFLRNKP